MNWNNYIVCFFWDKNTHHPPPAAAFFKVMVTTQKGHKVFFLVGCQLESNAAQHYEIRFIVNMSAVITDIILS